MSRPSPLIALDIEPDLGDAMIRVALLILVVYLAASAVLLRRWSAVTASWLPLITHVAVLTVTFLCVIRRDAPASLRAWLPLGLVPFLYVELRWINGGAVPPHADLLVAGWDRTLFGFDPSHTLALRWHSGWLSELLHLCYLAYYPIVYVPPAVLWIKRQRSAFAATVLAIVSAYTMCFAVYVLMPVDGPRFLIGPSAAPDGPIRTIVLRILEAGSSRGTAFPSAHVAASVVASIGALRFQPKLGVPIALLTAGMMLGAVYGGYHYAVDVIAGLVTGLAAAAIARAAERRITARAATPR